MNRKEIIENLKIQFKKLMFDSASTQLVTSDGKNIIVMGEDAAVGLEVYLLADDNTQTPLDNGDYILNDGRTITVTDGKISDVKAPEAEATENDSPEELTTEEPVTEEAPKSDDEVLSRITALEEAVNQILEMLQGAMSKTEQTLSAHKALTERVEKFASAPSTEKIEVKPKMNTGSATALSIEDILEKSKRK